MNDALSAVNALLVVLLLVAVGLLGYDMPGFALLVSACGVLGVGLRVKVGRLAHEETRQREQQRQREHQNKELQRKEREEKARKKKEQLEKQREQQELEAKRAREEAVRKKRQQIESMKAARAKEQIDSMLEEHRINLTELGMSDEQIEEELAKLRSEM